MQCAHLNAERMRSYDIFNMQQVTLTTKIEDEEKMGKKDAEKKTNWIRRMGIESEIENDNRNKNKKYVIKLNK